MTINCIIIDDEPSSQNVLKSFVARVSYLNLNKVCNNALEALEFLKSNSVDLLFLDINMPEISGINFYKSLKYPPKVIFTTAYSEYALDGFEVEAVDYLLKPFSFDRFLKAIDKVKLPVIENKETIIIKSDKKLHQIKLSSIYYIESIGDYIKIYLNNNFLVTYKSLKKITEELPKSFIQVHKSYVVNMSKVDYIEGNLITINKNKIPLGLKFKRNFLEKFKVK